MRVILDFIDKFFGGRPEKKSDPIKPIEPTIIKHGDRGSNGIYNATDHNHIENEDGSWEKLKEDVFTTITEMSDKELKEKIDEHMSLCQPDTCEGECQGTGWCEVATDFREKIYPPMTKNICPQCKRKIDAVDVYGCWMCGYNH